MHFFYPRQGQEERRRSHGPSMHSLTVIIYTYFYDDYSYYDDYISVVLYISQQKAYLTLNAGVSVSVLCLGRIT